MQVERLDHLVLTVRDITATVNFYTSVMGMEKVIFGEGRIALSFGNQKINLHQLGNEFEPYACHVQPGSADLCFIIRQPLAEAIEHLKKCKVRVIDGPAERTGATGKILSAYFRDPDNNLVEISNDLKQMTTCQKYTK
ncbi:MAG: VOC family protein [Oceanospirillales bacterium]|nr:VOC family protein [Oceanospirillales bacterium]MBR9888577.1 VOC family protein [Oceanospirillales bacterium]